MQTSLTAWAETQLTELAGTHRLRRLPVLEACEAPFIMHNGQKLINFSGNDALGLSHHPQVVQAATDATKDYGTGAGASRLVTGNHPLYHALESVLATQKGFESARVFGSGYLANLGAITALATKEDLILADKLCHACMLDGAQLSQAALYRFAHNDAQHLETLLEKYRADYRHCWILTETVFSMDGDRAPLGHIAELAHHYAAWVMADDAHGLGVCDPVFEAEKQLVDVLTGTLSKAAGAYGGYVCADASVIDVLTATARSFIYSTALPPATLAAAHTALEVMQHDTMLCERPHQHARDFCTIANLPTPQSHIVPLIIEDERAALQASKQLLDSGFWVSAIRPPTVPPGTSRLRVSFSAAHSSVQVNALAEAIIPLLSARNAA